MDFAVACICVFGCVLTQVWEMLGSLKHSKPGLGGSFYHTCQLSAPVLMLYDWGGVHLRSNCARKYFAASESMVLLMASWSLYVHGFTWIVAAAGGDGGLSSFRICVYSDRTRDKVGRFASVRRGPGYQKDHRCGNRGQMNRDGRRILLKC